MNAYYRETLESIVKRYINSAWMTPQIDSRLALIQQSVLQDTKRRDAGDLVTFEAAVAHVRAVIEGRWASVDAQLRANRRRAVRR